MSSRLSQEKISEGIKYIGKIYNALYAIKNKMVDEWVACKAVGIYRKDLWSFYRKVQKHTGSYSFYNKTAVALGYSGRLIKALEKLSYGNDSNRVCQMYNVQWSHILWAIDRANVKYVFNDPPELDLYKDLLENDALTVKDLPKDYRNTVVYCLSKVKYKDSKDVLEHYYGIYGNKMSLGDLDTMLSKPKGSSSAARSRGLNFLRKYFMHLLTTGLASADIMDPNTVSLDSLFGKRVASSLNEMGINSLKDLNGMSYADLIYIRNFGDEVVKSIFERLSILSCIRFSRKIDSYDKLCEEPYTRILVYSCPDC